MNPEDRDILIRLDENMRHVVEWTKTHQKDDDTRHTAIVGRVDTLEKDKIKVVTAGGVLGALVALCVKMWPK